MALSLWGLSLTLNICFRSILDACIGRQVAVPVCSSGTWGDEDGGGTGLWRSFEFQAARLGICACAMTPLRAPTAFSDPGFIPEFNGVLIAFHRAEVASKV